MIYKEMSKTVLENMGGLENITFIERCASRLRIVYKDKSKVNIDGIKKAEKVAGVVAKGGEVQVVIGPNVNEAYEDFLEVSGYDGKDHRERDKDGDVVKNVDTGEKKDLLYYLHVVGNFSASIFMPIVPALIVGGLILAIRNLLINYFGMGANPTVNVLLNIFRVGFNWLPIWVGFATAKRLKVEPVLGGMLGGILVHPNINNVADLSVFGLSIPQVDYSNAILPVVMGVALMYYIDKILKKILPEQISYTLKPLITMIIAVPATLCFLGPIGTWISKYVGAFMVGMMNKAGWLAVIVFSVLNPYIVMLGLDKATANLQAELNALLGYDPLKLPTALIGNMAAGGTALAVGRVQKDKEKKGMYTSFGITSTCGIIEPAWYGSIIMRPRAMIGCAVGCFVGGAIAGIFGLKSYIVGGCPGFFTALFFISTDGKIGFNFALFWIVCFASIASAFAATYVLLKAHPEEIEIE